MERKMATTTKKTTTRKSKSAQKKSTSAKSDKPIEESADSTEQPEPVSEASEPEEIDFDSEPVVLDGASSEPEPEAEDENLPEAEDETEPEADPTPTVGTPVVPPTAPTMSLKDACRRYIVGYKEHWYQGILSYAKRNGFPEVGTEEQCKKILKGWGAKLK